MRPAVVSETEAPGVARATYTADQWWEPVERTHGRAHRRRRAETAGRGGQTPVSQQQLNRAHVGAGFQEMDGKRVAHRMRRDPSAPSRA